jgi:Flp pilus assembly protein TadG
MSLSPPATDASRKGTATIEFAILLPLLAFFFVVALDFARVFYYTTTLTNCARNGALYLSDPFVAAQSRYDSLEEATLADASNLNPALTAAQVTSTAGTDSEGHDYVEVTVSYQFQTLTSYPGVTGPIELSRTVRMRVAQQDPNDG